MNPVFPYEACRILALCSQRLHVANGDEATPTRDSIFSVLEQLGCVQIDTLQMVARAHYLTIWSRLNTYDTADFDALAFDPSDRRIFEGWQHCACYIPTREYRYQIPHQRDLRENPSDWYNRWLKQIGHPETIAMARERVQKEGALKINDFVRGDHPKGAWWNWRPAKVALEYLYAFGDLMITDRVKFQRVYDLTERVLPDWVNTTEPSVEERDRFWIERGTRALGVCTPQQAGDYCWMKVSRSRPIIQALVAEGILLPISTKLPGGRVMEYLVHRENMPLLEQAADGIIQAERTTFLNPFDNLFWARKRDQELWNYEKSFEAYVPAARRKHGYYCMNILHKDRLVGRFDPRLDRKTNILHIKALYLEPGVTIEDSLLAGLAGALQSFLAFHRARDFVIEYSQPAKFGRELTRTASSRA